MTKLGRQAVGVAIICVVIAVVLVASSDWVLVHAAANLVLLVGLGAIAVFGWTLVRSKT